MQAGLGGVTPTSQWDNGLVGAGGPLIGNGSPVDTDFNSLLIIALNQAAYLLQKGVPYWDVNTTYYAGDVQNYGTPPIPWQCQANGTLAVVPGTDASKWLPWGSAITGKGICKAWVTFTSSGATGSKTILDAFNVDSVTKSATGTFLINFPAGVFANANYSFNGTGGAANGGTGFGPCTITNSFSGSVIKTTTQIKIFSVYQEAGGSFTDPPQIMLQFFGS